MKNIGTLSGERLAGLLADTCHKIQHGGLSLDELVLFNQRKNPFTLERNKHGHVVLTFTGLDLTGAAEIERLKSANYRVGSIAKSCLLSTKKDSYDKNHRLIAGRIYKVALMPGKEIELNKDRTTANLRKRGMKYYGYSKPLAGFIPRVREVLSNEQMEELGIWYATALHDPITSSDGNPRVLRAFRDDDDDDLWVDDDCHSPGVEWDVDGAFVFLVSANSAEGGAS